MRKLNPHTKKILLFLIVLSLPLLACGGLTVTNSSRRALVVRVNLPDGRVNVKHIQALSSEIWWAANGGPYSVEALPDEDYIQRLNRLSDITEQFLHGGDPGDIYIFSNELKKGGLEGAFATLLDIQIRIAREKETSALCSGEIEDLDLDLDDVRNPQNPDASVAFIYDEENGWSCK